MKKLLILTDESVLAGCAKSGIAEVADSLANVMVNHYNVSVVCPDGGGFFVRAAADLHKYSEGVRTCRIFGVNYYLVSKLSNKTTSLIDELKPDILHNFAAPEILKDITHRPQRCVYTIDQADLVRGKEDFLKDYDVITTVSQNYAKELLDADDALSETLRGMEFRGITNGILTPVFSPEKGLFVPNKYTAEDQSGKALCKRHMMTTYGIQGNPYICLMMCRLVRDKGIDDVLDVIHNIRDSGGFTVFVGKGEKQYEDKLRLLTYGDGAIWIDKWPSPIQAIPMLAAADFYLSPSISEPCGLMPMTSARFGAIPIATINGGLADNMDDEIAIIVGEDGMAGAISRAAELYSDKTALVDKRSECMNRDFSWNTRKSEYLEVYEK